ncbi:diguanylate cyclase domain-containing protein [Lysobacter zhanggongensis]|uniref:diguanylate cyclase n=1 Tax=Lysobacter zhanggongensis TaxID=1774951 RepID=A0ABU7YSA9_9GAMM
MLIQRLKADFRLTLMTVFGALTVVGITPFVVFRMLNDQPIAAVADVGIQLGITAIVLYAWRGDRMDRAGLLAAVFCSGGCVAMAHLTGLTGTLWLYPVLLSNFLLAARRPAVLISAGAIAVLVLSGPFEPVEAVTFGVTAAMVSLFAYFFSYRTEAQRRQLLSGPFEPVEAVTFGVTAAMVSLFAYFFSYRTEAQRRQLEGVAARDPLTGALNRRGLDRELERAIQAAARDGLPVGLAVLDLDHFKEVNDAFGHEAGDAVLLTFADLVRRLTRRDDRLFRLGGDEFALLLPGADDEALLRVAQTVRQAMQMHGHEAGRGVTVSIGATTLRVGESARDWMHRADTAMYDAKRAGSNRVVVARAAGRPADAPSPA